ncbi:MAG: hypothetical protein CVV05_00225 [Gammaproteobacteria bacterium HGW-Gammaproteobacteria-1]|jgi:ADP-dependent phosphofructokinase/glucokinase|nr:MAG: hypothetical protein CVV05_00225 [Gammaproteobacteria bacterium HGW-Gammaproteobacteria-1]
MDYDRLDSIAADVMQGNTDAVGVLSTGERLYVALAANNSELLGSDSIAYAIARLEPEAVQELVERHRYDNIDTTVAKAARHQMDDLVALVRKLVHSLKRAQPDSDIAKRAQDYLRRQGLEGSPLRGEAD